jgi:hypothetical protein
MRFSLRDLLLFVAFAAGIAWCAAQVGFDNPWFWSVIGVGAVMSALFVCFARSEKPRRRGWLATIPVLLFSFFFLSSAIFIHAALLTICGAILYYRERPSIRTLCNVCMASGLVALAAGVVPGALAIRQLNAERRNLPVVALVDRLQYERRHHSGDAPSMAARSTSVANELSGWERWLDDGAERERNFELLHNYEYVQFVQAIGFGVGRMRPIRTSSLRRPPLRNIDFEGTRTVESSAEQGY